MMELNREEIIKMLETIDEVGDCSRDCIFYNGKVHSCGGTIAKHALALIRELTEENARYKRYYFNHEYDQWAAEIKADTVQKMRDKILAKSEYGTINMSPLQLDQIAKELLEENNV
jgi:hypothetical protein